MSDMTTNFGEGHHPDHDASHKNHPKWSDSPSDQAPTTLTPKYVKTPRASNNTSMTFKSEEKTQNNSTSMIPSELETIPSSGTMLQIECVRKKRALHSCHPPRTWKTADGAGFMFHAWLKAQQWHSCRRNSDTKPPIMLKRPDRTKREPRDET